MMPTLFFRNLCLPFILITIIYRCSFAQFVSRPSTSLSWNAAPVTLDDTADGRVMWRPGDPATIFLQMGGGLVSGIGGGAVGIALGFIVGQAATPQAMSALTATIAGGLAGVVIGSTLGVYVAGKESGGSGSLLGTVLGTAVAVPLGYEVLMGTSPGPSRLIMAVLLVEVIGPIVGYHVSASTVYTSTPQEGRAQQVKTTPIGVEGGRIVLSFSL